MKERIVEFVAQVWQRSVFLYSGAGLSVAVIVFVCIRLLWIHVQRPAHLDEIAAAFGSSSLFHGAPQVSHSGNQFTFVKTSAHGYALYLCDANTGQKQILFELNNYLGQHGNEFDLQALPWSPDDNSFLCVVSNQFVIYPLDTNQPQTVIEDMPASDAVWLNPAEFAYLIGETNLFIAKRQNDGKWERRDFLSRNSKMSSLTVISGDTISWLEGNVICRLNLTEGIPNTNSSIAISTNNAAVLPTNGLALWFDASKVHQLDHSPVTQLPDLSKNKNDAFWNGRAPIFEGTNGPNAQNDKPIIHFASANSSTNGAGLKTRHSTGIAGAAPRSIFVVMRHDLNRPMMINIGDTSTKGSLFAIEWSDRLYLPAGWKADNRIKMASTNWNILETIYDGTDEKGYVNGLLRGIFKVKLNTADTDVEIGLRSATTGNNAKAADGDFAELLVYDRALNFTERKQVENYLQNKWFGIKTNKIVAQNPYAWFVPPTEGLTSFSYSKETGQFLFNCSEAGHGFLYQYDPQSASLAKISDGAPVQDEQWFGDGESAYYLRDFKHGGVVLRDSLGVQEGKILTGANILWLEASDADKLLLLGAISNQPSAGIWQYDITLEKLKPLIPYSDAPSIYAREVMATNIIIKSPFGENLTCTVYAPLSFDSHKKYPLVIGDTVFTDPIYRYQGPNWAPAIANCGGYVVIVDRKNWFGGLDNWDRNLMIAYNSIKQKLNIDLDEVYIFASSAETKYASQVITQSPSLWKGVIFLNPNPDQLPEFFDASLIERRPAILISVGGEEHEDNILTNYQQDALNSGVVVQYIVHPGEGHHIVGNAAELARTKAILHFIFME